MYGKWQFGKVDLMDEKYLSYARIFKAFCDENRLMVLEMLQSGEKCACVLLKRLDIAQPTLSHHMKILIDSGIVSARKEGKWTYYAFSKEGVAIAKELLDNLTKILQNCDCCCGGIDKGT
jgi:ArsR family transcriptional regulator